MTIFLGVSFGVISERVSCIATSDGHALCDTEGLSTSEIVAFLWTLQAQRGKRIVAGFDTASDFELAFSDLSKDDKDILFGLIQKAEAEKVEKDNPLYDWKVALRPGVVEYGGFRVSSIPGKLLRIATRNGGYSLYDLSSYFEGCDLVDALDYLAPEIERPAIERVERNAMPLWTTLLGGQIIDRCVAQAQAVALLGEKVVNTVEPVDLVPRQFYGPSSVASKCLNRWGARKQAKRLNEKNSVSELLKAVDCAYFGGRVEAVQLGTIKDIRTYDLNSAYAYGTALLSQFYSPLRFTRDYEAHASDPFSCWLVQYELPKDTIIGPLPTRSPKGGISFRSRGMGYFWQPEVDYMAQRYPDNFRVKWGYVCKDYKPVTFAGDIQALYDYRMVLKERGDKGEKIIKLALSNLYGKFAQNTGTAYYQCRAWAGWITSFIRRLLLEAVTGRESAVVCFAQDAIHLSGLDAQVPESLLGAGLGQYKRDQYAEGLYLSPGIYKLSYQGEQSKSASRGSNLELDFARIATELSDRQVSELSRAFFVGWQLSRHNPLKYEKDYLGEVSETLALIPSRLKARNYKSEFDWSADSRVSDINHQWSGLLSSRYLPQPGAAPAMRIQLKDRGWA